MIFLFFLYCFIVLLCIFVVSCPYVIYYPNFTARYSIFVLKVPLNPKQTNSSTKQRCSLSVCVFIRRAWFSLIHVTLLQKSQGHTDQGHEILNLCRFGGDSYWQQVGHWHQRADERFGSWMGILFFYPQGGRLGKKIIDDAAWIPVGLFLENSSSDRFVCDAFSRLNMRSPTRTHSPQYGGSS